MAKYPFAVLFVVLSYSAVWAQNEQAPIQEREIAYKDWTYKSIRDDKDVNLRDLTAGKKLVMVVYFAPWCANWRHDAPILKRFYDKYKADGLEIVAIGEYDPVASMKGNLEALKIPFPAVYESPERGTRLTTSHYHYRQATGDMRKWGSPWYIFLEPAKLEKSGDVLTKKAHIVNGEVFEAEAEKFIREKLGLSPATAGASLGKSDKLEICEPDAKAASLVRP